MKYLLGLVFFVSMSGLAQNTISLPEEGTSPVADLSQVSWIAGHWKGEAFGGITEEIWSPPLGGSMMFVFKLVVKDKVQFYEVGGIRQVDETLLLQLKHFNSDFKGWEEKNETVDFKLAKITSDKIFFNDFTFERISDNEMNVYVVISQGDGVKEEVKFNYKK
ncbi:DUF6265 family protein [Spongiimicrobium sp. 3-5]|uniref:DUF6265 family protein n=1 Tax=Spongiimicrobium sp. 3-5 TaxID=3332596 RepID=UPI00397F0B15